MAFGNRFLLAFFASAPCVAIAGPAAAANHLARTALAPLPHGTHLGTNGRYTQDVCDHDKTSYCLARRLLPASWQPGAAVQSAGTSGSPMLGTMTPADVLAAYSIPPSTSAAGRIVAIEDMPYTDALADLNVYRMQYGIPPLARCPGAPTGMSPCFAVVDQDGNLNPSLQDGGSEDGESGLDLDMVSAACPDCSLLFVEFTSSGPPAFQDFVTAAHTAATMGALATTISWGGTETSSDPTGFTQPGKMLVLAAAGDGGYLEYAAGGNGSSPGYPGSAPDVLSVGGTNLQVTSGGYTEVVWNDSMRATTSGCSGQYPMPPFQTSFLSSHASAFGTCTMRATSDLAAAAAFQPANAAQGMSGIGAYISSQGGWQSVVGTSASSPLVAGILVRLGLAVDVSNDLGFVYENIAAFNDVTSGNDTTSTSCTDAVLCTAGPGWDGPTGVGTPNGAKLAVLLAPSGSSSGSGSSNSSSGSAGSGSSGASTSGSSGGGASGSSGGSSTGGSGGGGQGTSGSSSGTPGVDGGSLGTSSSGGFEADAGPGSDGGSRGLPDSSGPAAGACACRNAGASISPLSNAEIVALLGGVVALIQARRRRGVKSV